VERRLLLPLPQLALRPGRTRVRRRACADQPARAALPLRRRQHADDWRGSEGGCVMSNLINRSVDSVAQWVDERAPGLKGAYNKHVGEYYTPKSFNVWYYFGSPALLMLVNQIVTGIWLTMNYKPSAAEAFASVEYIMRDVQWGWLIRYMHSAGASLFFIVVYLHMFRGLIYGSYQKPRELVWLLGMCIFLALMAEDFFG